MRSLLSCSLPRRALRRLADIIDMLTMHPEARRRVARSLGEIADKESHYQQGMQTAFTVT